MVQKWGTRWRQGGISLIEVITAIAILSVGIWAMVTLFPRGQDIIRRSGVRQLATQLAHEVVADYLANPAKMPFAIVPFDPRQLPPLLPDEPGFDPTRLPPLLLEPAYLRYVRRAYNFVWGEPIDDALPLGDPNKRIGLVQVAPNEWRAVLQFLPAFRSDGQLASEQDVRVYREVRYRFSAQDRDGDGRVTSDDLQDLEFYFDPTQPGTLYLAAPVTRPVLPRVDRPVRVLRVTYLRQGATPLEQNTPVVRELYLVPADMGQVALRVNARSVLEVVEEFPIVGFQLVPPGVLVFDTARPRPPDFREADPRLGALRVDYLIDGPFATGHWVTETGATFDPDPVLRRELGIVNPPTPVSVFQTTFGGLPVTAAREPNVYVVTMTGDLLKPAPAPPSSPPNSLPQKGLLVLPVPPGTTVRVAYRAGDDPATPVDESWFLQVIVPPGDFQPFTQPDQGVLSVFPFESLRWFGVNNDVLQFLPLLAGLNVHVRYRTANNEVFTETLPIAADGTVRLSQTPASIERVTGASALVRVSGGSMWSQSPPKTRADYAEMLVLTPPLFAHRQP